MTHNKTNTTAKIFQVVQLLRIRTRTRTRKKSADRKTKNEFCVGRNRSFAGHEHDFFADSRTHSHTKNDSKNQKLPTTSRANSAQTHTHIMANTVTKPHAGSAQSCTQLQTLAHKKFQTHSSLADTEPNTRDKKLGRTCCHSHALGHIRTQDHAHTSAFKDTFASSFAHSRQSSAVDCPQGHHHIVRSNHARIVPLCIRARP